MLPLLSVLFFSALTAEESAVSGLQKRYASVTSIKAEFQQTYRAPGVEQVESGVVWLKKPGLMRWEYRSPESKLFIADGRDSYLYSPEDRQVMIRRYSDAEMHSTPLLFLLGEGNIAASFKASPETEMKPRLQGTIQVRLTPHTPDSEYSWLVLEIEPRSSDIRRIVIRERTGNTSEFLFTNMETNVKVETSQFRFKMPKGVEIVRLDAK